MKLQMVTSDMLMNDEWWLLYLV